MSRFTMTIISPTVSVLWLPLLVLLSQCCKLKFVDNAAENWISAV